MTTAFSIRKPAYHKHKYSKPRAIQSPAALPSYTLLPPSPPHKQLQHQQHQHQQHHHGMGSSGVSSSVDSTLSTNSRDVIVGDQWIVLSKIGEGSFGEVFEAEDIWTHRHYAIKRESLDAPFPQLKHESIMYDVLMGGPGIPQCQWYGEHDDFACIVIDLLGPSLKQVREAVPCMPLDIVVELGCQMVTILEHIHSRGIVYRDVKPDNFLFPATFHLPGNGVTMPKKNPSSSSCQDLFQGSPVLLPMLSVVDLGLATWWRNPQTNRPYPQSKRRIKNKTGTARYASLNVHRGKTHGRRDDMESLGYLLTDLMLGSLPWTGIQARNSKAGWDRMRELKEELPLSDLCDGLPVGLMEFIEYTRRLHFSDQPNYDYLRRLLRESCQPDSPYAKRVDGRSKKNTKSDHHQPLPPTCKNNNSKTSEEGVFIMDDLAQELAGMAIANGGGGGGGGGEGGKRNVGQRRRNSNNKKQQHPQAKRAPPSPPSPSSFSIKKRGGANNNNVTRSVGWNTHRHRLPAVHPHPTGHHEDWTHGNPKVPSWGEQHNNKSKPAWDDHRRPSWL